ncbi:MAG: adenylate/guanylate cyclase domain-containing protein [Candidatus Kaiserbacteria bacterium]|nr:adenylate/guanylate cyclase domain-containing protein [Candidatus Kaiserbacteria bacterium]
MSLFQGGWSFFRNTGHVFFLIATIAQFLFIVRYRIQGIQRVLITLFAPTIYTIIEISEGWDFVLNAGHIFIWFFALTASLVVLFEEGKNSEWHEKLCGSILIILNVSAFMFSYFYEEVKIGFSENGVSIATNPLTLRIDTVFSALPQFITDPSHIYLLFGSIVMAFAIIMEKNLLINLKNKIKTIFGSYVDDSLSDLILEGSASVSERTQIAVLFADVRGFTTLSEHHDAQQVMDMLNVYYQHWFDVSRKHNGIIDKYIGDGIMLWWRLDAGHGAAEATQCALEMLARVPTITQDLHTKGLPCIQKIGIGISVGEAIVGNIGHDRRRDYTCIGDTVNTASRLESASKELKTDLVIDSTTYNLLSADLKNLFSEEKTVFVKGREQGVPVYCLRNIS